MRLAQKQIANALGFEDREPRTDIATALLSLEKILDHVAGQIENDFHSAALGDASNLVQLIREGLSGA